MVLKTELNADQRYGWSHDEIEEIEAYLRKKKTAGAYNLQEAMPYYELYIIGYTFDNIVSKFPSTSKIKLMLTAALFQWNHDRDTVLGSIHNRIKSSLIKSSVEQIEFLTQMISVTTTQHRKQIEKYLEDPDNNPPPEFKINNFKDYQQVVSMIGAITESVQKISSANAREISSQSQIDGRQLSKISKKIEAPTEEDILDALIEEE